MLDDITIVFILMQHVREKSKKKKVVAVSGNTEQASVNILNRQIYVVLYIIKFA